VVIPTTATDFLAEAVNSVLSQKGPDLEVLIVTNAPNLNLSDLPDDERLRFLDQPREGKAFAVNLAAFHARGEWLAFLDQDDLWEPTKLAAQLDTLAAWDGVAACMTQFRNFGNVESDSPIWGGRLAYADLLAAKGNYIWSSLLLRRSLFAELGGLDPSYRFVDDFAFVLRLHSIGPVACVQEPLTRYRVHGASTTYNNLVSMWLEGARTTAEHRRSARRERNWELWAASWRRTVLLRRWCASDLLRVSNTMWDAGRVGDALRLGASAVRVSPPDVIRLALKWSAGRT